MTPMQPKSTKHNSSKNHQSMTLNQKVSLILYDPDQSSPLNRIIHGTIFGLILTNVILGLIQTLPALTTQEKLGITVVEYISVVIFAIDYFLRVLTANSNPLFEGKTFPILRYLLGTSGLIDLCAFLPFLLTEIAPDMNMVLLNFLKIMRFITFFKILRYFKALDVIRSVLIAKREELIMTFILGVIVLFFSSVFVYYAEFPVQPEKFPNLFTSMYWAGITLGTVGYGEIIPITPLGKTITSALAFVGIALYALPISIMSSGFIEMYREMYPRIENCPQCGKRINYKKALVDIDNYKNILASIEQKKAKRQNYAKGSSNSKKIQKEADLMEKMSQTEALNNQNPQETVSKLRKFQTKLYYLFVSKYATTLPPKIISFFFFLMLGVNGFAIMMETTPEWYLGNEMIVQNIIIYSIFIFTAEYFIRAWVCVVDEEFKEPIKGRLKYLVTPLALIDLFAILPFYLQLLLPIDTSFLTPYRFLIILKIGHYTTILDTIGNIIIEKRKELLSALILSMGVWIMMASIMYYAEREGQANVFSSIPASLWWSVITLSTIGYGDMFPLTTIGRITAVCTALYGTIFFSLPGGIIGAGFFEQLSTQKRYRICPSCGYISKLSLTLH